MKSIDIRIGRFRLSFAMPLGYTPSSVVELEQENTALCAERAGLYRWQYRAIDLLGAALRGEPEDKPSPHPAECAAALIRRLREERDEARENYHRAVDVGIRYERLIEALGEELGVERCYDENAMLLAIRSLRASAAPIVKVDAEAAK